LKRVFALSQISEHLAIVSLETNYVFDQRLIVVTSDDLVVFAILQSRIHEIWARTFSSTLETRLSYNPSECFQTYAFPPHSNISSQLGAVGGEYQAQRAALMTERNEGLTQTYNRFHDRRETAADIVRLRELHAEMDRAVLRTYGWDDLAERAEPQFLDETNEDDHKYQGRLFWPAGFRDEVLARLLALNAERTAAERENETLAPRARAKRTARSRAEAELLESVAADEDD
jgi:hypothetical protein